MLVVQCRFDVRGQAIANLEGAFGIHQAVRPQIQPGGGNQALGIVQSLADTHHQPLFTEQLAATVIQVIGGERQRLGAGHFPALVIHAGKVTQQ